MRSLRAGRPSLSWYAETPSDLRESLQKVVSAGARTLLASRGGPFDVETLSRTFSWLVVPQDAGGSEGEDLPQSRPAAPAVERVVPPAAVGSAPAPAVRTEEGDRDRPRRHRPRHRRPARREGGPDGGQLPGSPTRQGDA
jgi:hypothetical protein